MKYHVRHPFLILLFLAATLLSGTWAMAQAPVIPCRIKAEYPHDPMSFTQGLFVHNSTLYESSGGFGKSYLAISDIETGRHRRKHAIDSKRFAEGIAHYHGRLYLLTWLSGTGYTHDLQTLAPIEPFDYRVPDAPIEGWGLAFDGARFILSSGSDIINFHQPEDFSPTGSIHVRDGDKAVRQINELEQVEDMILANIWKKDVIAVIDPATGKVASWIDLAPLRKRVNAKSGVANGIAYDKETGRLYVTGKYWNKLFEIEIDSAWFKMPGDSE